MSSRFRQVLRVSLYLVAATLAINAVWLAATPAKVQVGPESAFTTVLQETVTGPSGTARKGSTQLRAVRSDGSTVLKLGSAETGSRLIWFSSGIEVMTNDRLRLKSTMRKPDGAPHRDSGGGCMEPHVLNEKLLAKETIAGYQTAKVSVVHGHGANQRAETIWYALDHGCATIKSRMDFGNGEASEWRLLLLTPGEPANSLFEVPADYREVPTSALSGPPE